MNISAALDAYMTAWAGGVHTALPAKVSSYDDKKHRAKVVPSVRHLMDNGLQIELPELVDVPVIFPSAASFDLEFPLEKGDPVLLIFAETDIASWKKGADPATPDTASRFSLDASVAIPGLSSSPVQGRARITIDKTGVVTWTAKKFILDGQVVATGDIIARGDVFAGPAPAGPGVSLSQHIHPSAMGPTSPATPTQIPPEVQ